MMTSVLRRNTQESSLLPFDADMPIDPAVATPPSVLRRPNHQHPFAPFIADDLAGVKALFEAGFDPFDADQHGLTCIMVAAERGHSESLHLALKLCVDPARLVLLKTPAGLDAFDLAAASESVVCMAVISKHLPSTHMSAINRGQLWHAVEASQRAPGLADAWLADLCLRAERRFIPEAVSRATELGWSAGLTRLRQLMR